ncbi:MAG TPA: aminotransferase class IV [Draconibacterium sp.]|nr:aminotransferase class IV [Draconibacterium sp.]
MDFIIINGEIVKKQETGFKSFFWDEPFIITQKIWFGFGGIPLFHENIQNIKAALIKLNSEIPDLLNDEPELFRITKRMLNKNRFFRSGIITIQVFIGQVKSNLIVSSFAFPEFDFPLSKQGLLINFSEFEKYSLNPLNQFTFFNAPFWKFAKAKNQETVFNNSIFLNEKEAVCNCISSNIFVIKGSVLYTPSVETGCYIDTLRSIVLETAKKLNLKVEESDCIEKSEVFRMDEIFLAGEEQGIQMVLGVENKRFVQYYSRSIHEKLNEYLKKKVT